MPPTTYPAGALAAWDCHPPSPSAPVQWELPWGSKCEGEEQKTHQGGYPNFYSTLLCCITPHSHLSSAYWETTDPNSAVNPCVCVCVCVHARVCLCLIGIVSISKGPDSHPPSPCETKAGQLMMPWMSLDQLSHVYERQAASVRDTVNVLPLEVLRVAALNTGICWLNYWWHWRMISVNKWDHCEHLSDTSGIVNASVSQD